MHLLSSLALTLIPAGLTVAQETDIPTVLERWIHNFETRKLTLHGLADLSEASRKLYGGSLQSLERFIKLRSGDGLSNIQALRQVTEKLKAESSPSAAKGLLIIAGTGISSNFYHPEFYQVRAIGHAAHCDKDDLATLHFVQRTARGEASAWAPHPLRIEYRAAALHVLGNSKRAVFRPALETQLLDIEPALADKARGSLLAEFGQGDPRLDAVLLKTYPSSVRTWSRGSIAPGTKSNRALSRCLDRMHAEGGTELYGGILRALGRRAERHATRSDEDS